MIHDSETLSNFKKINVVGNVYYYELLNKSFAKKANVVYFIANEENLRNTALAKVFAASIAEPEAVLNFACRSYFQRRNIK